MIAVAISAFTLLMLIAIVRWIASVPLIRTLSASIDAWADEVHGEQKQLS